MKGSEVAEKSCVISHTLYDLCYDYCCDSLKK